MRLGLKEVLVSFCAICAPVLAAAQSTPQRTLLALSKHEHTLALVDPATLQVIGRAPVGPDPHEVIASLDGRTAYVSIYGGGRYHAISGNRPGSKEGRGRHRYGASERSAWSRICWRKVVVHGRRGESHRAL